jgi:hypothetical protein
MGQARGGLALALCALDYSSPFRLLELNMSTARWLVWTAYMYAQSGIERGGQALDAQFSGSDDFWGPRLHVQRGVHLSQPLAPAQGASRLPMGVRGRLVQVLSKRAGAGLTIGRYHVSSMTPSAASPPQPLTYLKSRTCTCLAQPLAL